MYKTDRTIHQALQLCLDLICANRETSKRAGCVNVPTGPYNTDADKLLRARVRIYLYFFPSNFVAKCFYVSAFVFARMCVVTKRNGKSSEGNTNKVNRRNFDCKQ